MDLRNAFRKSSIVLSLLGCATLGSACFAHSSSKVKDDQLGRLSVADREPLINRERDVNVAKANVDASEVALDEAKHFRKNADEEAKVAKQQQKQVADDLKKADKNASPDMATLQQQDRIRAERTNAREAKSAYADQLVDLREAQVENSKAEHELMEARLSRAQYDQLAENDLTENLDAHKFIEREAKAEQEHQKTSQKVQEQLASARASKEAWTNQQQVAQAGVIQPQKPLPGEGTPQLIEAPRPPDSSLKMSTGAGSAQAKSNAPKDEKSEKSKKTSKPKAKPPAKTAPPAAPTTQPAAPQSAAPAAPSATQPMAPATPPPAAPQPAPSVPTPPPAVPQP